MSAAEIAWTRALRQARPMPIDPEGPAPRATSAGNRLPDPSEPVRHGRPGEIRDDFRRASATEGGDA